MVENNYIPRQLKDKVKMRGNYFVVERESGEVVQTSQQVLPDNPADMCFPTGVFNEQFLKHWYFAGSYGGSSSEDRFEVLPGDIVDGSGETYILKRDGGPDIDTLVTVDYNHGLQFVNVFLPEKRGYKG